MLSFIKIRQFLPIFTVVLIAFFLRIYQVDKLPPGLYDDEVSLGYNAYSILSYGKDEYGVSYPLWFKAFGEYKLPLYIYSDAISIAIFGKNELAVRFPSVIFGTLTILFTYLLTKELLLLDGKNAKFKYVPILGAMTLAVSPWHIQFSRGAYEAIVATCLYLIGLWIFLLFYKNKNVWFLLSSIFFIILASYTYNFFRVFSPLTIVVMFYLLFKEKLVNKKGQYYSLLFLFLLNIPLIFFTLSMQGYTRFLQTSMFTQDNLLPNQKESLIMMIFDYMKFIFVYIKNYFSYFSIQHFFIKFNDNVRFYSSSEFGFIFRWQLPFLIVGFFILLKEQMKVFKKIILGLLFGVPLVCALTVSPNALRALLQVIPISIITGIGVQQIFYYRKIFFKLFFLLVLIFGIFEILLYFHMYNSHYANSYRIFWGGAEKKIVKEATKLSPKYYAIVVKEDFLPNQKIHFLFYNDKLKPLFVNSSWQKPKEWKNKKILYIRYPLEVGENEKLIENISLDTPRKEIVAQFIEL